ncbi:methyl-accepting chemotaxis protein [Paenibacillus sp. GCM10027627]|uniref:methyl-accepting chemotaxis protein n=1 Tax=unclassified Paenibacillus TaxID=185978 RepID=UPI0036274A7C
MFKWKNRSLVVTSSLVLTVLLIVMIAANQFMSYHSQKKALMDEINHIGETLGYQLEYEDDLVSAAHEEMIVSGTSLSTPFGVLKQKFDGMVRNALVTNAYIYMPEVKEEDGKRIITMLQSNQELVDTDLGPGGTYAMNATFDKAIQSALEKKEVWTSIYSDSYGQWISYVKPITDSTGNIVGLFCLDFDYGKVSSELNKVLLENLIIAAALSAAAILIVVILVRAAVKPLRRLAEMSELAAAGDLTIAVPAKGTNEIALVSQSFNTMIASLRKLTQEIRSSTIEVAESASNMQESAEQTSKATEEVTEAIQEVASGSDAQLLSFQECQRAMGEMAIGIGRIAESASSVSELATDAATLAVDGESVIEQTQLSMRQVEANIEKTTEALRELREHSDRIGDILGLIGEVADQTNLLALNASIEAARAGEHGKGFAVVAVEIRKLAERSKESSAQIGQILHSIGDRSKEAAGSMEHSFAAARVCSSVASQAGESFRAIVDSIKQVSIQVQEVSAASQQMSAGSEEIAASLDELEGIAQTSAGNAQRVAAASEQQLASMQEVASSSEQLRNLASDLNNAVGYFKT